MIVNKILEQENDWKVKCDNMLNHNNPGPIFCKACYSVKIISKIKIIYYRMNKRI